MQKGQRKSQMLSTFGKVKKSSNCILSPLNGWDKNALNGLRQAKSVIEHAQNAQIHIILLMRKVSSWPVLSSHTFCST